MDRGDHDNLSAKSLTGATIHGGAIESSFTVEALALQLSAVRS